MAAVVENTPGADVQPASPAPMGSRVFRGSWISVTSQGVQLALRLAATVVLARLLTPDAYGLVAMVTVVTGFIGLFKSLGLGTATIQAPQLTTAQLNSLFWLNVAFGALAMAITMAVAPLLAWFYGEPEVKALAVGLSITFLIGGFAVQHGALLRRDFRFGMAAAIEIASTIVGALTTVGLALADAGPWALVGGSIALELTGLVLVWRAVGWRPAHPSFRTDIGEIVGLGRDLTQVNVLIYWARNLDNFLIGRFWGTVALGLYTRAYQLLLLPLQQVTTPLSTVAIAALSRLHGEPARYRQAYVRLLEKIAIVCVPLTAFLFAEAHRLIELALGAQWLGVVPIFRPLAIAGLVQPVSATCIWLLISQGRRRDLRWWSVIGPMLTCAAIVIGVQWGPAGVAVSYAAGESVVRMPLLLWFVGRSGPVGARSIIRAVGPGVFAGTMVVAVCAAFERAAPSNGPVALGVMWLLSLAAAAAALFALPAGRHAWADIRGLVAGAAR